jgi:hypothetical protein
MQTNAALLLTGIFMILHQHRPNLLFMRHLQKYALAGLLLLSACTSAPGDSEVTAQVLPLLIPSNMQTIAEIKNLHKGNGFEIDENTYAVDIDYQILFKKSFAELAKPADEAIQAQSGKADILAGVANFFNGLNLISLNMAYGDFKAGDKVSKHERVTFIKTENGWMLANPPQPAL